MEHARWRRPENENWESRYAIDGCTDIPAICPFTPLGDFDLRRDIDIDAEVAKRVLDRVVEHDIQVPEFVKMLLNEFAGKGGEKNKRRK